MSTTIDQRVVEMGFDNREFERNVQTSISTLDKLKNRLNLSGASKGLDEVGAAAKRIDMSGLHTAVENVGAKFSAVEVMAVTALANITNQAVNAGKRIVSSLTIDPIKMGFEEYETQMNAVQTILANTQSKGKTITDVNGALDELNSYADKTIYNFTEMTRNIGTFTAAGVDLDTSVAAIKGIANLAAVSGSTSQQASTAMYQLSQALSSGTVKLQDWNSVVNAGMGGQIFQDALKETARVHGVAVDQIIEEQGSFRESLSEGWITSEILTETLSKFTGDLNEEQLKTMGYTEEQIKEIVKMGKTANDAATKVKTFTQLFDTLKEAAQSGWTQTWEIIVGDFEEAKEMLTEVSDVFGAIIGASADARNAMLQGWKDLGGRTALIEAVRNAFKGIVSVITPVKEAFREIFPPITSKQLYDFTVTLKNITEKLKLSEEQSEKLKKTFRGLFAAIDIVRIAFVSVWNIIKPLISGVGTLTGSILNLTGSWGEWLSNLRDTVKETDVIAKTLQKIVDVIKKAISAIKPYVTILIGSFMALGDTVKSAFEKIKKSISPAMESFKNFIQRIKEKLKFPGFEKLVSSLKMINKSATMAGSSVDTAKSIIIQAFKKIGDAVANSKIVKFLQSVWKVVKNLAIVIARLIGDLAAGLVDGVHKMITQGFKKLDEATSTSKIVTFLTGIWKIVQAIAGGIVKLLGDITEGLVDGMGNVDFGKLLDMINAILSGGLLIALTNFINGLGDFGEGFSDILEGLGGALEGFESKLKAEALLKIAIAVAVLAGSLLVLSTVDSDSLSSALLAITTLFADLIGSMTLYEKMSKGSKSVVKASTMMISMSIAVLILAAAMKSLAELDMDSMARGITGVIALVGMMVAATKLLSSGEKKVVKGAVSMIAFALAVKILASVCNDLSNLSWEELAKGLVGVGVLLAELALFLKTAKFSGKAISTATGIVILSAALKILANVCSDFGAMSWEVIGKGLASIGALLLMLGLFTKLTGNAKHVISTSVSLVIIAAAMKILASVMTDFASMSWEEIGKGLTAMAGALAAITIAVNLMPKNLAGISVGLVIISAALLILSDALIKMGGMSWEEIGKGLLVLGSSLLILAVGLNVMKSTLPGAAALLVASAALLLLSGVLSILGAMSWESIVKGLVTLAGAFAVIGVAGLVLTPLVPTILALAGAITLIGVGVLAAGAGLMAIGAGLSLIAIGLGAVAAAGTAGATALVAALTIIITGIAALIPAVLVKIGEGIIAVVELLIAAVPLLCKAVVVIVTAIVAALVITVPIIVDGVLYLLKSVLEAIVKYTPDIVAAVFNILIACLEGIADKIDDVVKAAIDVVLAFIRGVAEKIPDVIQAGVDLILAFINGLAAAIENNTEPMIEAITRLMKALLEAAVSVVTNGWEMLKEGVSKLMDSGFMQGIKDKFNAAKDAVKELIDKAKTAVTDKISDWKQAGKDLLDGLIQGIKDKVTGAIETVKEFGSNILGGLKDVLGINSPSKEFAEIGRYSDEGFVVGLKQYANKVSDAAGDVGENAVDSMSNAISKISDAINDEMDADPTIRPVLDLSNVESGTRSLNAMLSREQAMTVSAAISKSKSTNSYSEDGVGTKAGNTYQFTQNNYSPKALSQVEIYRQTKNQFSAMERLVDA